jgi:hypothetical protein
MEVNAKRVHVMGAGILFFLFLLLLSPKAVALTKDSSHQLLMEASVRAQDELMFAQAEQARRTHEYVGTLDRTLEDESASEFKLTSQFAENSDRANF